MSRTAPPPDLSPAFRAHDHSHCTDQLLARAEELGEGRLTPVRRRTLEILLEAHKALGAYDVLERLSQDGFAKQPPVVYRALDFLVEHGLAHRVRRLNAFTACTRPGEVHAPVFLICRNCDALAEAAGETVVSALKEAAGATGFVVERTSLEAVGLCPACAGAEA